MPAERARCSNDSAFTNDMVLAFVVVVRLPLVASSLFHSCPQVAGVAAVMLLSQS
jgi:hypothetical protein